MSDNQSTDESKREQMVQLVREVQQASACMMDFDALMTRVEKKFGNKQVGKLIFDPPGGKMLSAEEIVDTLLNEKNVDL